MGTSCFLAPPGPEGETVKWGEERCLESGVDDEWQWGRGRGGRIGVGCSRVRDWGWELEEGGAHPSDERKMRLDN